MKIGHYFFRLDEASGGVSRAIYDLVRLVSREHEVTLITGEDSRFPDDWSTIAQSVRLVGVTPPSGPLQLLDSSSLDRISQVLETLDILHLHGLWRPSASQVARRARKLGTPYILTPHGTLDVWSMRHHGLRKRIYYQLFERRNLAGAAVVHCTADAEVEQSRRWIGHDRIVTLPYAVDLSPYRDLPSPDLFRSHYSCTDEKPAVLFLSRLHPKKGVEVLLEAMGRLADRGKDCQLWLAGVGETSYVERMKALAEHRVPQARFLELVTGDEKLSLYRAADLMALPTHQENFGLVLPESLACGTPVVTTRGTDIWREIEASGGAQIVERTPQAFCDAIADLLDDRRKASEMGRRGRDWVFDWLDPETIIRRWQTMYRQVVSREDTSG